MNRVMIIFFIVLILAVALYYILPLKYRWIVLLLASLGFYAAVSTYLVVFVAATVVTVYFGALWIQKNNNSATDENKKKIKKGNKAIIAVVIVFNLGIIGFLKYFNFFGSTVNTVLGWMGVKGKIPMLSLFLPLGISFYTLQAIGYLIDVYRKKFPADRNFFRVALFMVFFLQIMEGPIARYEQTAHQLYDGHRAEYKNLTFGAQRILWGLFKKMVVADRLYLLVNTVSTNATQYSGIASLLFILFYALQLYADFSGFIDIVLGAGELFGVKLPENFRQPFFAKSAQEFWKRWHTTLGVWLKEYVFYSVALSPRVVKPCNKLKKKWRNHFTKMIPTAIALLAVWTCNGLWHGPEWQYIVYGMYYFVIICAGMMTEPLFKKLYQKIHLNPDSPWFTAFRHIRTLLIIFIGETIFGASSLPDAFHILFSVFKPYGGSVFSLGLDYKEFIVVILGLLTVLAVDIVKERGIDVREGIAAQVLPLRWTIYLALGLAVLIFGAYGGMYTVTPFIYEHF